MDIEVDQAVATADEQLIGGEGGIEGAGAEIAEEVEAGLKGSRGAQGPRELEIASGGIAPEIANEELRAALEADIATDAAGAGESRTVGDGDAAAAGGGGGGGCRGSGSTRQHYKREERYF